MPPQNQNAPNNPNAPDSQARYDFFMNPQQASKPKLGGPTSAKGRIIVVVSGVIILFILVGVVSALLNSGPKAVDLQTAVAQDQQEIIRLNTGAAYKATAPEVLNFAITTEFTVTSDQQQLVAYLAKSGLKLDDKKLALKQNAKSDLSLTTAQSAGLYDQAFLGIMQTQLATYGKDLNAAYKITSGKNGKTVLKKDYADALVLIKQVQNLSKN